MVLLVILFDSFGDLLNVLRTSDTAPSDTFPVYPARGH